MREPEGKRRYVIEGEYSTPEIEYLKDNIWEFTEKVDGTNIRVIYDQGKITFKGRTERADIPGYLLASLESIFNPKLLMMSKLFPPKDEVAQPITLYGEGYGPKIQKVGKLYRDDVSFVLFDIRVGHYWLRSDDVRDIAAMLGIDVVPIVGEGTLEDAIDIVKAGLTSTWGKFTAEGLVMRPKTQILDRQANRIITKIKHKDFKHV